MVDWMNPSQDMLDARQAGRNDMAGEIDELNAEVQALRGELEEKTTLLELANEGLPMDGDLWAAMKDERDGLRTIIEDHIRMVYSDGDATINRDQYAEILSSIAAAMDDYRDAAAEASKT
jgi:hypothetical protein